MHEADLRQRAVLFQQLATLQDAGIPADRALNTISADARLRVMARQAALAVADGVPLSKAGTEAGLFSDLEGLIVENAMQTGDPAAMYRQLSHHYDRLAKQQHHMISSLLMPALLIITGILVSPLPRLLTGDQDLSGYLLQSLLGIATVGALMILIARLPSWLVIPSSGRRHPWPGTIVTRLPLIGDYLSRQQRLRFLDMLSLMLEAGIPVFDAIEWSTDVVSNPPMRRDFARIRQRLQHGMSLAEAFRASDYFDEVILHYLNSGEHTGDIAASIRDYTDLERTRLDRYEHELTTWLPRLVYLLVVIWVAYSMVSAPLARIIDPATTEQRIEQAIGSGNSR